VGGKPCLDEYAMSLMPTEEVYIVDVTINGFNYAFMIDGVTQEVFDE
jgi:hypothetical protein